MKNTFKKALLASAIASSAGMAQAAVVSVTPGDISLEGSVGQTSVTAPDVTVTLAAEYTQNDTVTFTIDGAEYDIANSTPAILFTDDPNLGNSANAATVGFLGSTANSVTFRITAVTDDASDGVVFNGGTFVLSGMEYTTASVTDVAGDIDVSYSATTNNGDSIDNTGTLTATNATVVDQLSSSVTQALDAIIDVNADRQQFTTDVDVNDDILTVTIAEASAGTADNDITYAGATITLNGDFSWMDVDSDGTIDATEDDALVVTTSGDDTTVITFTGTDTIEVVGTDAAANAVDAYTFTFTNAGQGATSAILAAQDFSVTTTISYDESTSAKASLTNSDTAGEWTLNGSIVRVPYLVVNDSRFGLIANVTNHGSQTGDIVLDIWDVDGTVLATNYAAGSSTPGSLVSVAAKLNEALAAAGKDLSQTTKFSFQITTNVPADDIFVYAAYTDNTTAERAIVNTDAAVQTKN